MMSNKILITLTILFIINCDCGEFEDCTARLKQVGFSADTGFLNFIIAKNFNNIHDFQSYLKNQNNRNSKHEFIKYVINPQHSDIIEFFNDNFKIQTDLKLQNPNEFCEQQKKYGCGIHNLFVDSVKKCTENIIESYGKDENAYTYILKSMEMLVSSSFDKSGPININGQVYTELLQVLPATNSPKIEGYIEVLKENFSKKKKFESYYNAVKKLKDGARDYWYSHIKILKSNIKKEKNENREENNGENNNSKYFTIFKWCKSKYLSKSKVSNIST